MTSKICIIGDEARTGLYDGFKTVADMVASTGGPGGRTIAIQQPWGSPKVTKDGVTVAKSISLKGIKGEGAKMIIQASEKTGRDAGDGTTATCVIAKAIVEEGLKYISKGVKSTTIKKGIDKAVAEMVAQLKEKSKPITTNEEIKQVATISANGDEEIGSFIAKAIDTIGRDGVVTVEEGRGLTTELELVEGLQIDQGYLSPYFMTNPEKQLVEFDNPLLFLYDGKINNLQSILPLLEEVSKIGRPIVFVVDDVDGEPLTALVVNHMKGVLKCCAIKAPSFGDIRNFVMEDIAVLTGGQFVSTATGVKLEKLTSEVLGTCSKIKISPSETIIIGGNGNKELINERIERIRSEIEVVESSYDKEKLHERLAKLTGGVAIIKVGGATEIEVKEKKDRVDDAVCSTRAALEEGVLPGGGVSMIKLIDRELKYNLQSDESIGYKIFNDAIKKPLYTISENAGFSGDVVMANILNQPMENGSDSVKWFNYGFNARTGEYVDMVESGILDATKVVRCALENGVSVASSLLTVEGVIIDDESDKKQPMMPQYGM